MASPNNETIHVFFHEDMLKDYADRGVFNTDPGFLDVLEKRLENSDRVKNIVSILKRGPIAPFVSWHLGRPALISELLSFHTPEYVNELVEGHEGQGKIIGASTFLTTGSWNAALLSAGTTISAMKHVMDGEGKISYALVRPPGHHAQPAQADGYCFLNNVGLAVQLALDSGCKKVVVVDIDVHYGNGTAEGFYRSDKVLTISLHMNHGSWGPSHPQRGTVDELGEGEGVGYNLNIPLPNGTGDRGYEYAMTELVLPAVEKFEPEMMVLAAGLDSSAFDPNGRQCLTMEGYRKIGQMIRGMAEKHCDGRILIVQEGGYQVTYSAYCLHATLEGVLNDPAPLLDDPIAYYPEDESFAFTTIESIKKYHNECLPFFKATDSLRDRWERMKAEVDAFVSVYDEAVRLVGLHNGKNDEGVLKYALQMYKDSHENKDFQSLHVWNALKEAPNKRMVGSHSGKNDEDVLKYALQMKEYPEEAPNEKVGRLDDPMKSTRKGYVPFNKMHPVFFELEAKKLAMEQEKIELVRQKMVAKEKAQQEDARNQKMSAMMRLYKNHDNLSPEMLVVFEALRKELYP